MPCIYEEADTQIFLHVNHIVAGGTTGNNISKRHKCLSHSFKYSMLCDLGVEKLWISFGQGDKHS